MTLTLNLAPELERELRRAADEAGLPPDAYILHILRQNLRPLQNPERLPRREAELLEEINRSLSAVEWDRYHALQAKRGGEALTAEEQVELVGLTDEIESANARRMEALAELARLRRVSLRALMAQLGLTPRDHA